jgi:hypothetical protein
MHGPGSDTGSTVAVSNRARQRSCSTRRKAEAQQAPGPGPDPGLIFRTYLSPKRKAKVIIEDRSVPLLVRM